MMACAVSASNILWAVSTGVATEPTIRISQLSGCRLSLAMFTILFSFDELTIHAEHLETGRVIVQLEPDPHA
jgi:hypothetical protein